MSMSRPAVALLVVSVLATALPASGNDQAFYYSHGRKIALPPPTDQLLVQYRTPSPLRVKGQEKAAALKNSVAIQKAPTAQSRATLETSSDVIYTSRIYESPGALIAATNEIIVRFDRSLTSEQIREINDLYNADIKRRLLDGSYVLELNVKRGEEAVAIANEYYRLDEIAYAHPNFIRKIRERPEPHLSVEMELGTQISDNGGAPSQQLGGITPLDAGSKDLTTILRDHFSGSFPGANWTTAYLGQKAGWGRTAKNFKSPQRSLWCAKRGPRGKTPGKNYRNNLNSWMIYGPFSLEDAKYAEITFQSWVRTEPIFDKLKWLVSIDGTNFVGYGISGDLASIYGWMKRKFILTDVPELGDITGQTQVWFSLNFESDASITDKGVYVDDVRIEEYTAPLVDISNDPLSSRQWSLNNIGQSGGNIDADIDAPGAWGKTTGDSSIIVAVLDVGIDLAHPDLQANLVVGYDATDRPSGDTAGGHEPGSDDAHGTACAGIIAAVADNNEGITGIAPDVTIMPIRIFYSHVWGGLVSRDSWIVDGMNWAWKNGAHVLSNSWGGGPPSDAISRAIRIAKNRGRGKKGSVVLFAAGNDDADVIYPAQLTTVIGVGASSPCDQRKTQRSCDGEFGWGSNYGPELDVVAPGVQVPTTDVSGPDGYSTGDYIYNFNGTSAACPHAAAVVALMLSANPKLTEEELTELFLRSADNLKSPGRDDFTGHGRINARRAVSKVLNALEN